MYKIYDLKCNAMTNPIGIGGAVEFSWKLASDENNISQKSFEIILNSADASFEWRSGDQQSLLCQLDYFGEALESGTSYVWKVISTNDKGQSVESSEQSFVTGLLDQQQWVASWVSPTLERKPITDSTNVGLLFSGKLSSHKHPEEILDQPVYLRKEINLGKQVKKAVAYATAHGIYSLFINGQKVSNLFAPEYTVYDQFLEYQTYDITEALTLGENALAVILADGWYTGKIGLLGVGNQYGDHNAFLMQVEIEFEDGSKQTVVSDDGFQWSFGPLQYADIFVGERHDANAELNGWLNAGYDTTDWKEVNLENYGYANLQPRHAEPIAQLKVLQPKALITTPKGETILDVGENIVGYTRFRLKCNSGQIIELEHSEELDKDGNFFQNIIGQNKNQKDVYIFADDKEAYYEPQFTFHGFRYVKITGLETVDLNNFECVVIGSELDRTGEFTCSDANLNQLQENIFRSQQGNMISIPTDCPQRERAGYTGDMQVYTPTAVFNQDLRAFMTKWLSNIRLEQQDDGQIPNVIPRIDSNKYIDGEDNPTISSAGWADGCIIMPYRLYQAYGDIAFLQDNYEMMKRWLSYVEKQLASVPEVEGQEYSAEQLARKKYLWTTGLNLGDWLTPSIVKETGNPLDTSLRTKEYVSTAVYAYVTGLMIEISEALGDSEAVTKYTQLNRNICQAYNDEYVDSEGRLPVDLQGIYVLTLKMSLVSEDKKALCAENLVRLIKANDYCLDTGFISGPFLLDALVENGYSDVAYKILFQKKAPSWLYQVEKGATTIWENWNNVMEDGTKQKYSYNHFAFGCVGDFMYRHILGIQAQAPGYSSIRIQPDFSCGLSQAKGSLETPYGSVSIEWTLKDNNAVVQVTTPPSTQCVVSINGKEHSVGNGTYHFSENIS